MLSARNPNGLYDERRINYDRNGNILSLTRTYNGTLFFSLAIPRQKISVRLPDATPCS
jgi:hypothetical protein